MTTAEEFNLSEKIVYPKEVPEGFIYSSWIKEFIRRLSIIPFEILDAQEIRQIINQLAGDELI